jgi:hypothetical protein
MLVATHIQIMAPPFDIFLNFLFIKHTDFRDHIKIFLVEAPVNEITLHVISQGTQRSAQVFLIPLLQVRLPY